MRKTHATYSYLLISLVMLGQASVCLANDPAVRHPLMAEIAQTDPSGTATKSMLFGGVQKQVLATAASPTGAMQAEKPQLAPGMAQGGDRSARLYGSVSTDKSWFQVPSWMSGVWRTQDRNLLADVNYRTGKQVEPHRLDFGYCGEHYGWQKDKHGGFWQYTEANNVQFNFRTDPQGIEHFDVVDSYRPGYSNENEFVLKKTWHSVAFDPYTNRENIKRFASTMTFSLMQRDLIMVTEAVYSLAANGEVIHYRQTQTRRQKVASFEAVDLRQGQNVKAAFNAYMADRQPGS